MKIGLFGGSFDPVHNGHISMIKGALKKTDVVIVIPSVRNSFKRGRILNAAPYRYYETLHVVEDIFGKQGNVLVSDIEFFIDGISYTVTTIEKIRQIIPAFLKDRGFGKKASEPHEFYWICGSDILPTFDKWYRPEGILEQAALLVAKRPGDPTDIKGEKARLKGIFGENAKIKTFEIDGVEASSSDIRSRRGFEKIPKSALDFIKTHDLFPEDDPLDKVSDEAFMSFYEAAISMYHVLGEKRLLHTLNVGILSARYAVRFGEDPDKALLAGALHDCAKEIDIKDQLRYALERCPELATDEKLYHSPAGAVFAGILTGEERGDVLDAITYHTTGRAGMTTLEKIVFLADKLEPSRTYADLTKIRAAAEKDLDEACRMTLLSVIDKFRSKGRELHPYTAGFASDLGIKI